MGSYFLWGTDITVLHNDKTGSGANPLSYPLNTGGSFSKDESSQNINNFLWLFIAKLHFTSDSNQD
jgi:hypothetical protein